MKYRPDIDGLRAVAIILVLIFHGGLSLFPSGFIGVDVFFVISGFLITTIINESLNNRNFSFIDFYNRRLWRLQPVLVCLVFFTLAITLIFFLPYDLIQYTRSARKTSLFFSNLFFNSTTSGYFSADTNQLPLLHTWSLSIEWQCYLVLPIFMYLLHCALPKKYVTWLVFLLTLFCLIFSLYSSQTDPIHTYYQFSSRVFEFLIGSCVALLSMNKLRLKKPILDLIGFISLISIVYIATLNHIQVGYPNVYALVVCLSTALLIAIGTFAPNQFVSQILSVRPLVFLGLLSYSLYIWHWTVFSIVRYESIPETPVTLIIIYSAIFIISYLSWYYIERPSRRFKTMRFRHTLIILLLLPIMIVHISSYIVKENTGFPQRFNKELVGIYHTLEEYSNPNRPLCVSDQNIDINAQCKIGATHLNSKKAFMMGDSFSNHYWGFMDTIGKAADVSVLLQATPLCMTLPGIYLYDWYYSKNKIYQKCRNETEKYYRMIQENHYDYVIIGEFWPTYLSDHVIHKVGDKRSLDLTKERLARALDQAINIIAESGAKPVLIHSTALLPDKKHDCFYKHIKLRTAYDPKQCSFNYLLTEDEQWLRQLFREMKMKHPQLVLIDPKKVQCQNQICTSDINGIPVFRDGVHITDYASYQLGSLYLQKFHNPLV